MGLTTVPDTFSFLKTMGLTTVPDTFSFSLSADYAYDPFNQQIRRVTDPDGYGVADTEQTFFLHDQGQVALQFDKSGSGSIAAGDLSHRYLWNPGVVDQLLTDEHVNDLFDAEENETLWALTDRQGSVTDMVDSNATLRLHRVFDSFGNIVDETHYDADGLVVIKDQFGYLDAAFAYTGRLLDKATGLQNNLNRWYDASVGRWMSEDPIGFNAGDANLYRYVGNGPVNGTDPSGLWEDWGFGHPGAIPPSPEVPYRDPTGRIHGPIPRDVPSGWCKDNIEDAIRELEGSIQNRKSKGVDHGGLDHHHDKPLKKEENLLKKLKDRLREIERRDECQRELLEKAKEGGFWLAVGGLSYWIVSEGSRLVFPPRNLLPIP